jgi:hypothetical protein
MAAALPRHRRRGALFALLTVALWIAPLHAAGIAFAPPVTHPVGVGPYAITMADLDQDGDLDVVVSNYDGHQVSVSLNHGNATFDPPSFYPVGWGLHTAVADLNGDGRPDLAVANFQNDNLSLLMNTGGGAFGLVGSYPTGHLPRCVVAADLDGDGLADLAVGNAGTQNVTLLRNLGGTFTPAGTLPSGDSKSIDAADIDGDGRVDLVTGNSAAHTVTILRNLGGFAFSRSDRTIGANVSFVELADLDGDGDPDIATANENSTASVLLNLGAGAFGAPVHYGVGPLAQALAIGDFDGDGHPDLAVASFIEGRVAVLQNAGNGTFLPRVDFACGPMPRGVAAGDLDGDGDIDLASGDYGDGAHPSTFSVLLNAPAPPPPPVCSRYDLPTGAGASQVAAGDLDGDGNLDLVVANENRTASVYMNEGGTFSGPSQYAVGRLSQSVALGDLDGDGDLDAAVANFGENNVTLLLNDGVGHFGPNMSMAVGVHPRFVALADLNGDGAADIVTANYHDAIQPGSVTILRSRGRRGGGGNGASDDLLGPGHSGGMPVYHQAQMYPVGVGPYFVGIADLNGDGRLDLWTNNYDANTVSVLMAHGNGGFGQRADYAVGWGLASAVADFDRDGDPDLAVANFKEHTISMLFNSGGTFGGRVDMSVGHNPRFLAAGDLDGDQSPDLVVAESGDDQVGFLRGLGNGHFERTRACPTGHLPKGVTVADLDDDGAPDVIVANAGAGTISVLPNEAHLLRGIDLDRGNPVQEAPRGLALAQSYPNPARAGRGLTIRFQLPATGAARLRVFDVAGRQVASLVDGERRSGIHDVSWSGADMSGARLKAGVYLYRLEAAGAVLQKRLVLE